MFVHAYRGIHLWATISMGNHYCTQQSPMTCIHKSGKSIKLSVEILFPLEIFKSLDPIHMVATMLWSGMESEHLRFLSFFSFVFFT